MSIRTRRPAPKRRWPPASHFALAVLVAAGYAAEVLFQPNVFEAFSAEAILQAIAWEFLECLVVGWAIVAAVAIVERRAQRRAWLYTVELVLAIASASTAGTALWGAVIFRGNLAEAVPYLSGQALRFAVIGVFLALVDGFRERSREATAHSRELQAAEAALSAQTELTKLRLLEAQIEPHFLFNTIATLRRTWRVDPSLGERMHANVMRYLAATLPQMRSPIGTLGDEMALARSYLELFALRMGDRLAFSIDFPPQLAPLAFPRMVLLTLVENAIKHGLAPADDGGTVAIAAHVDGGRLLVRVADDGVGFGMADTGGTGIGLANIRARLLTQFGGAARLGIRAGAEAGVEATIALPLAAVEPAGRSVASAGAVGRMADVGTEQMACMPA